MDVRRLLARLRSAFRIPGTAQRSVTASLAAVTSSGMIGGPDEADRAAATPRALRRASVVMWLAEGRRLHPRRVRTTQQLADDLSGIRARDLTTTAESSAQSNAERAASARISLPLEGALPRTAPGAGTVPVSATDATTPVRSASVSGPISPIPALPPDIRVDFTGELSGATLAAIEQLDATQRRLIFLRYLVEQGVYNEGFGAHPLPDQYRRSRGLGDEPAE